jgi:hypothetical protein
MPCPSHPPWLEVGPDRDALLNALTERPADTKLSHVTNYYSWEIRTFLHFTQTNPEILACAAFKLMLLSHSQLCNLCNCSSAFAHPRSHTSRSASSSGWILCLNTNYIILYRIWGSHSCDYKTFCGLLKANRRFGGTCRLHLQGRRISQARNKRESRCPAEKSVFRNFGLYRKQKGKGKQQFIFRCLAFLPSPACRFQFPLFLI